jgi:hypothetical protein
MNPVNIGAPSDNTVTSSKLSGNITMPADLTVTGDVAFDSPTFVVDNANSRVGLGTATPSVPVDIVGEVKISSHLNMPDNAIAKFGADSDLQIYHDGSHSYVSDQGTGSLLLRGTAGVYLQNAGGTENMIAATASGAVTLYYSNASKLATTSTGIDVTGVITSDGLTLQTSENTVSWASGNGVIEAPSNLYLRSTGSGTIYLQDNIDVTGTATMDGLTVEGNATYLASLNNTAQDARIQLSRGGTEFGQVSAGGNLMNLVASGSNTDMRFLTNSAERMRIDTAGYVTIGSSALSADAGLKFQADTGAFTLEHDRNSHALTLSDSDGTGEVLRVDTSGNLLVGTTDVDLGYTDGDSGVALKPDGPIQAARDSAYSILYLNKLNNNGPLIDFHKDGVIVGSIGVIHNNNLFIGAPSHSGLQFGTSVVYPTGGSTGDANDATVDIGASGQRFKDLYLSGKANAGELQVTGTLGNWSVDSQGVIMDFTRASTSYIRASNAAGQLQFQTGGSNNRLIINSSGKVGIGTSSPVTKLHIKGSGTYNHTPANTQGADFVITSSEMSDNNAHSIMQLVSVRQSLSTGSGSTGYLGFSTIDDSNGAGINDAARIAIVNTANSVTSPTALSFWTNTGGNSSGAATEAMRIDSLGNLLVGKTAASLEADGHWFRANGESFHTIVNTDNTLHIYDTTNNAYRFYISGGGTISATSTSITGLSDERLKENIVDLETGLSEVMALQPRRFDWKNGDAQNVAGFIAQEVESVLPELVGDYKHEELDDCKSLKMGDMIPTLVKAIQEQQTQIETLKQEIREIREGG